MNEDAQQQFVSWLAQKLGAKDEQDLKAKMQQMGNDGIKQAYNSFMQEQQQSTQGQEVPQQMEGGKLDYLKCLQAYKKGGKVAMDDCGCGTAKMKSGGRMDKEEKSTTKNYMGNRKDGANDGLASKKYTRGSADTTNADKSPGKKDMMSKGKKKEWITAKKSGVSSGDKQWTTALTKISK